MTGRAGAEAPRAVVLEETLERGRVAPGDEVVHEFVITNDGDAPLRLADALVSRGVRVERYDPAIAPGQSGRVRVVVDTWSFRGSPPLWASFSTNDSARPKITLALKVEVRPRVLAQPGHARYLTYQGGPEGTIAQTLWDPDGADFRVIGVESPVDHLSVTYREANPAERDPSLPGRQWRVEGTIASESPVGALLGFIRVRLDHPGQREMHIPISGFVRPLVAVTPPAVVLGDVDPAASPRWMLDVKTYAQTDVEVIDATTDIPGFRAEVQPVEPGRSYRLRLEVEQGMRPGPFNGTIRIRTSSPKQTLVEVPLSGRIVSAASSSSAPLRGE